MSSFICEKCGKEILDSPLGGYYTFCPHYPPENNNKSDKEIRELKSFDDLFPGINGKSYG